MTLRIGIIGAGIMGADHARILAEEVPGITLQVICDADQVRAKITADANGAKSVTHDQTSRKSAFIPLIGVRVLLTPTASKTVPGSNPSTLANPILGLQRGMAIAPPLLLKQV